MGYCADRLFYPIGWVAFKSTGLQQDLVAYLQVFGLWVALQRRAAGAQEAHDVRMVAQAALQVHLLLEPLQRRRGQLCIRTLRHFQHLNLCCVTLTAGLLC